MILPGSRVVVFDPQLYVDDVRTPLSVTLNEAIVVARYGYRSERFGIYPDLVDVKFLHNGRLSKAHFTDYVIEIGASSETEAHE